MKRTFALLMAALLLTLSACANADGSPQAKASQVQQEYQLKAGETIELDGFTFDEVVTVIIDPASTRSAPLDMRSSIYFDNCVFNGGLTIVGDYHAMVTLGQGCIFPKGSVVTFKEATAGTARETTLEDNLVKLLVTCDGVCVETESAAGVLSTGPDVVFNAAAYSKSQLAPDAAILGIYSLYQGDTLTYTKLAIEEDDTIQVIP